MSGPNRGGGPPGRPVADRRPQPRVRAGQPGNGQRGGAGGVAALAAARQWADGPTEPRRRACETAAVDLAHKTPASWCAAGAFFSTGSAVPPAVAAIPSDPTLATTMLHGAVSLAAVVAPPRSPADCRPARCPGGRSLPLGVRVRRDVAVHQAALQKVFADDVPADQVAVDRVPAD